MSFTFDHPVQTYYFPDVREESYKFQHQTKEKQTLVGTFIFNNISATGSKFKIKINFSFNPIRPDAF